MSAVVLGGGAVDVDGSRSPGQDSRVPVGQALDVVVEVGDRVLPQRGQLGVDGIDVRLAQGVAGQVDLPQRVPPPPPSTGPPSKNTVPPGTRLVA